MVLKLRLIESMLVVLYATSLPLSLTASWVLLTAGIAVSLILLAVSRSPAIRDEGQGGEPQPFLRRLRRDPLLLPLAAFAAAVTVSGAFNGGDARGVLGAAGAIEALRSLWALKAVVVYFWAGNIFARDPRLVFSCLQPLLIVSAVAGLWGAVQQLFNFHPFGYPYLQGTGFHGGPMAFAGQMQLFSLLALAFMAAGGREAFREGVVIEGRRILPALLHERLPLAAVVLGNLCGLFFAGERSAWLGGAAGVLLLCALLSGRLFWRAVLVIPVLAALSWVAVPLVRQRFEPLLAGHDVGVTARLKLWQEAVRFWQESPLVGIGFRKFPHYPWTEAIVPGRSVALDHAHSNYFHILATTGLIGLAAFVWLWWTIIATAISGYFAEAGRGRRAASLGIACGATALCVSGAFEYNFGTAQVRMAEWFLFAVLGVGLSPVADDRGQAAQAAARQESDLSLFAACAAEERRRGASGVQSETSSSNSCDTDGARLSGERGPQALDGPQRQTERAIPGPDAG